MMRNFLIFLIVLLSSLSMLYAQEADEQVNPIIPDMPSLSGDVIGNIQGIYLHGQSLANRADVFSKVGDSSTVSPLFLSALGEGYANLGDFSYLQGTIDYFSTTHARTNNSFANQSLAAGLAWSAVTLSNPNYAFSSCERNEAPLVCEYRLVRPIIAIIMLGTNEVTYLSVEDYRLNMGYILDTSIGMGVIPVLTTIPYRYGNEEAVDVYNHALREIAASYHIPVIDYAVVMDSLPNDGLDPARRHPSIARGNQYRNSVDFTGENLHYGFTMRNLMTLQMLTAIQAVLP